MERDVTPAPMMMESGWDWGYERDVAWRCGVKGGNESIHKV